MIEEKFLKVAGAGLAQYGIGDLVEYDKEWQLFLNALERPLTGLFVQHYPKKWKWLSLDGLYGHKITKTAENGGDIFGMCLFVAEQKLTPFSLTFNINEDESCLKELTCRIGQNVDGKMIMLPYMPTSLWQKHISHLDEKTVDWVYEVSLSKTG